MKTGVALALVLSAAAAAQAQYSTGFEPPVYTGSPAGTPLTNGFGGPAGQDNWYNPVSGSHDLQVETYAGNSLGFVNNPNGGTQFIGSVGTAAAPIGRAQHTVNFGAGGTWRASWDVNGAFIGTAPAVENLGSFSLQPSTTADYFQQIMQWGANAATPTQYNINYGTFTAAGGGVIAFNSPGAAWTNIPVNHWIHQDTTWSFASNQLLSVTIQDITAGTPSVTTDVSGNGWYLAGGANNVLALALPTDIRAFTGNTQNATGWDNFVVAQVPAPGSLALLGLAGFAGRRRRR